MRESLDYSERILIERSSEKTIRRMWLLGKGNRGAVWRIEFEDGTIFCYKKDSNSRRLRREGRKYRKIYQEIYTGTPFEHPIRESETAPIKGIFIPYLGKTLSWKKIKLLPDWAKICVCYGITQSLILVQEKNIFHRDFKLDNLVINKNGIISVIDLGRSVDTEQGENTSLIVDYSGLKRLFRLLALKIQVQVAPEYYERGQIGPWSDVYSLGAIFKKILKGVKHAEPLYYQCLSRHHEERPSLLEIKKYLLNPLLGYHILPHEELTQDLDSLNPSNRHPMRFFRSLSLDEQAYNQWDYYSMLYRKIIDELAETEIHIFHELNDKIHNYMHKLDLKIEQLFTNTSNLREKRNVVREGREILRRVRHYGELLPSILLVQETIREGSKEWKAPERRKHFDHIIQICEQVYGVLATKAVLKDECFRGFSPHIELIFENNYLNNDSDDYSSDSENLDTLNQTNESRLFVVRSFT